MNIPNERDWGKLQHDRRLRPQQPERGILGHASAISRDWVLMACLALTASLGLGIGLLAAKENQPASDPLWIEQLPPEELPGSVGTSSERGPSGQGSTASGISQPAAAASAVQEGGKYVASKNGTKYYVPSCAAAKRIKSENRIWFSTEQEAQSAGYQPSTACKGL